MAIPVELYITVGGILAAGGSAWGGAKVALNGTRQRVKELVESHLRLDGKLDAHTAQDATVQVNLVERAARTEAKVDLILERLP